MKKGVLEKLSFGFEIEGLFHEDLALDLNGEWITDGSVHCRTRDTLFSDKVMKNDDCSDCDDCSGCGYFNNDCECDSILVCGFVSEHEHDSSCYHNDVLFCALHAHTENNYDNTGCWRLSCYEEAEDFHEEECSSCSGSGTYDSEDSIQTEYNSKVYYNVDELLADLKKFNKKNYHFDSTCGLHLHVGMRDENSNKLFSVASDWNFMKKLNEEALGYCECQKDRLQNKNYFCKFYDDKKHIIECAKNESSNSERGKYLFCRFHPELHTLEFRFFRPCEHKVKNVQSLLNSLTDYLESSISSKVLRNAETDRATENLDIIRKVDNPEFAHKKIELYHKTIKEIATEFDLVDSEIFMAENAALFQNRFIKNIKRYKDTKEAREAIEKFSFLLPRVNDRWVANYSIILNSRNYLVQNERTLEVRIYNFREGTALIENDWRYPYRNSEIRLAAELMEVSQVFAKDLFARLRAKENNKDVEQVITAPVNWKFTGTGATGAIRYTIENPYHGINMGFSVTDH